jgi:hypothetical protein
MGYQLKRVARSARQVAHARMLQCDEGRYRCRPNQYDFLCNNFGNGIVSNNDRCKRGLRACGWLTLVVCPPPTDLPEAVCLQVALAAQHYDRQGYRA